MIDRRRLRAARNVRPLRRWWLVGAAAAILGATVTDGGTAGAADRPAFVNGDAKASANLFDLKVQIAGAVGAEQGLAIGFGAGRALSQYQDSTASSEGRLADYSLADLLNMQPTPECPDVVPLYLDSTKPPLTRAESTTPGAEASQLTPIKYAGFPTYGSDFGTQDATAGPSTTATATTAAPMMDSGVLKLVNPRSESTSRVVDGVREAVAVSTADSLSLMGGALTLFRPTWTATSKSGATTVNEASFTYSSAQILGISRPGGRTDDLQSFKGFIESAFSAFGLRLYLPKATTTPGPNGTGSVSISPIVVGLENIPLGSSLLKPVLRAINPRIEEALAAYLAQDCSNPGMQLIADVARGILSGKGGLSFAAGGADAMTDDVYYPPIDFSLGTPTTPTTVLELPESLTPSGVLPDSTDREFDTGPTIESDPVPTVPEDTTTTTPGPEPDDGEGESAAAPRTATVQRATDRSRPGTTGGTAGWITVAGLGAVLALALGDHLVMRRSRRRFSS